MQASLAGNHQEAQDKTKGDFCDKYKHPFYDEPLGFVGKGTLFVKPFDQPGF
ncbi:hypothetical protein I4000191A8_02450 [Clostridia bacterium i40-0019-1A8]